MKLKEKLGKVKHLAKATIKGFSDNNIMKLAAALSYYTIFSLLPLLIIIISLVGYFFSEDAVRGTLFSQINSIVGNEAAEQIQEAVKHVKLSGHSFYATAVSLGVLLFGASRVFAEIQDSINFIWGIKAKPKKGLRKFLFNRLMSFSMIGTVGFLLAVGLIINAVLDILSARLMAHFPEEFIYLFILINNLLVFVIISTLFALIFRTLPDGKVILKDCLIGASFTTVLFMLGKFLISIYLSNSMLGSIYGAASSLILILIWVYYSSIVLYFGAVFTKVYAVNHGNDIVPNAYTVKFSTKTVEEEKKEEEKDN